MSKYRELTYMVLDELKLVSDDAQFNEEHIIFLLDKFRAFLIKQKYSDIKKQIPESNYQEICLDLEQIDSISNTPCINEYYLKSTKKIPTTIPVGNINVYPINFYQGNISYVSRQRMKYVGYNKYLKNIIYCSLSPNGYLYFKSNNPQFLYLEKVKMVGIFESIKDIQELQCDGDTNKICDILDMEFPIEEPLIAPLIQLTVKELAGPSWRPSDDSNNASDDLARLANFIARNSKSNLQKQIEGD